MIDQNKTREDYIKEANHLLDIVEDWLERGLAAIKALNKSDKKNED